MISVWTCIKCGRIFQKKGQAHSCRKVPLEKHFEGMQKARELFDHLLAEVNQKVGRCQVVSIPCCVHLFGEYDFLAALPKKDSLEIRFALGRKLKTPKLKACVPLSKKNL